MYGFGPCSQDFNATFVFGGKADLLEVLVVDLNAPEYTSMPEIDK